MSAPIRTALHRRMLDGIRLLPHERDRALHALARAEVLSDAIVALLRLPGAVLRAYQREGGVPRPHPSHE